MLHVFCVALFNVNSINLVNERSANEANYVKKFLSLSKPFYFGLNLLGFILKKTNTMAIRVVEFSNGVYKIRKIFA